MDIDARAVGALQGLALGDALGMPTQSMDPDRITATYGPVRGLVDASADQPIAPSMPAGSVTDDTEQALLVAGLIVKGAGHIDPRELAERLLAWEDDMRARGSLDLLGPSTKTALEAVRGGADIDSTGKTGTTNGAAMRVTPVGIANPTADALAFADAVYESCRVTHDTVQGFQSAALVAAAVSLAVDGAVVREALEGAVDLVEGLPPRGAWSPRANVVSRARTGVALARSSISDRDLPDAIRAQIGTSVEANESIPAAIALAWRYADGPLEGVLAAANLGGDTDTIGCMAGAILGAAHGPDAWPRDMLEQVSAVSRLDLGPVAAGLARLRPRQ